ncbi:sugar nucleotide-binding protein [Dokdonia donghaensis]|uniref:sugar nucleotide-binding protein n=1 Tax=Dokdonia donghaensis TaxID=326320 RepID=UPI0007DDFAC8|nr:sugar nucleotide-binding protein [Dokdonia donghaensis]ANH60672.1 RmlD substrate binding domain protein [Dokdonia donghaensis DSW-1]
MGFFIQNKYAIAFKKSKDKILILGASGFLGNALYKELYRYYNTYGTYHSGKIYSDNKHYLKFDLVNDDVYELLRQVQPSVIISALRGPFTDQLEAHELMVGYAQETGCRIIFLSSANVFDAFSNYPSYENDKTLSQSIYGKLKIRVETLLMRHLPEEQYAIVRLPMVFGVGSPRIQALKNELLLGDAIEVFPHLVMNTTTDAKLRQQIHYIINRKLSGIFHLGSTDLIHHKEFIHELVIMLDLNRKPIYKNVFTSNTDRYLAVLPRDNRLPKHLQITNETVVESSKKYI